MEIPEHPDIARTLETGYPEPEKKPVICMDCNCELRGSDMVYFWDSDRLCEKCFTARVSENYSPEDIAEHLGIFTSEACDCEV